MQVTLHIGSTKTGSSALQFHMSRARDVLSAHRICYPSAGLASNAHHVLFAAIHPNAWRMHGDVLPEDEAARFGTFDRLFDQVWQEADATGAEHVVLSSEYLWGTFPARLSEPLRRALAGRRLRLVAAVRRQDFWLEASYLQAVKSGLRRPFAEWRDSFTAAALSGSNYGDVLASWEKALRVAETRVVPYEFTDRTEFTRRMVDLMCDAQLGHAVVAGEAEAVNPSPTVEGLRLILDGTDSRTINGHWRPEGTQGTMFLDRDEQRRILDLQREVNRSLAHRFSPVGPEEFFNMEDLNIG